MHTWSGRVAWCQKSHEQQQQVDQVENPHGWKTVYLLWSSNGKRFPQKCERFLHSVWAGRRRWWCSLWWCSLLSSFQSSNPPTGEIQQKRRASFSRGDLRVPEECASGEQCDCLCVWVRAKWQRCLFPPSPLYSRRGAGRGRGRGRRERWGCGGVSPTAAAAASSSTNDTHPHWQTHTDTHRRIAHIDPTCRG